MSSQAIDRLRARTRAVKARASVRAWQYRQRHLSSGVWFRLRRTLASAKAAFVIPEEEVERLLAEGHTAEACGRELAPEKALVFVGEERLLAIPNRREIPLRLGPDFLTARAVALLGFDTTKTKGRSS